MSPALEFSDHGLKRSTLGRQLVTHANRLRRLDRALHQSFGLQLFQPKRERAVGDLSDVRGDFGEPQWVDT